MTIETRGTIELKDIKAFEFECPKCHAKILVPLLDANLRVQTTCQHCNTDWLLNGSNDHRDLYTMLGTMRRFAAAESTTFILRFEVAGLTERKL